MSPSAGTEWPSCMQIAQKFGCLHLSALELICIYKRSSWWLLFVTCLEWSAVPSLHHLAPLVDLQGYLQAECLWNEVTKWRSVCLQHGCATVMSKTQEFWFHFCFLMATNNWIRKIILKTCNFLQFKGRTELFSSSLSLNTLSPHSVLVNNCSWKPVSSQRDPGTCSPSFSGN